MQFSASPIFPNEAQGPKCGVVRPCKRMTIPDRASVLQQLASYAVLAKLDAIMLDHLAAFVSTMA
jgi:hypothetical protein